MSTLHTDQQIFDREVAQKGKLVLEALAGFGIFAALVMSIIALMHSTEGSSAQSAATAATPASATTGGSSSGGGSPGASPSQGGSSMGRGAMMGAGAAGAAAAAPSSAAAASAAPTEISLKAAAEVKKGPDGQMHDAFSVTEFHVVVGKPVTLNIDNVDSVPHSISAPEAGVNIVAQPGTHKYTLVVTKAGKFEWNCMYPCDPWSMQHVGYMRGFITA
ncbi:MAG: cupredoxin domain-containing protein, partial [Acidobacteriota bacterium]|nr:cupredoxin domain-containing protein [Acidobacteriota bacterium]